MVPRGVYIYSIYGIYDGTMMALYDCIWCIYIYITVHPNMNQHEPIRMTARFVAFLYSADIIWPYWRVRHPKTNMAPKKVPFQKESSLATTTLERTCKFSENINFEMGFPPSNGAEFLPSSVLGYHSIIHAAVSSIFPNPHLQATQLKQWKVKVRLLFKDMQDTRVNKHEEIMQLDCQD